MPASEKPIICRPRMVLLLDEMESPCPVTWLPSRITPALLASIVKLPWEISGKLLVRIMGVGELGGKIDGSKVIKSPRRASNMA